MINLDSCYKEKFMVTWPRAYSKGLTGKTWQFVEFLCLFTVFILLDHRRTMMLVHCIDILIDTVFVW